MDHVTEATSESKFATQRLEHQKSIYTRRRMYSAIAFFALLIFAIINAVFAFGFLAFVVFVLAAVAGMFYFDANGHLHELRRRSTKSLAPNFSLLEPVSSTFGTAASSAIGGKESKLAK